MANGQIVEKVGTIDSGNYIITHGGMTEASSESVKPLLRIYNKKGEKVLEQSSLDFYQTVDELSLSLKAGKYRAELAMAASPLGPITSGEKEGLFKVSKKKKHLTIKPDGNWSSEDLTATMTKTKNDFTFTFTREQLNTIMASDVEKVTLVTDSGARIQINTSEFKKEYANNLTVNLSLKNNRIIFGASVKGKNIQFLDDVSISLPKKEFSVPLEEIVILRDGKKGYEVVPHDVTDEGIVLKVKQSGQYKISTNKKSIHDSNKRAK